MGLNYVDLKLLMNARRHGARFKRIATIGRLSLNLHPTQIRKLQSDAKIPQILEDYSWGDFCEPYLRELLGVEKVVSIDASDYEGAEVVHDMNEPIERFEEEFDLVIDGGSLEHIFNFPVAVSNVMRMAQVGGHVLMCNPANNLCGHGFFQFSPELMYRVFSVENGFAVCEMLLTEHSFSSQAPPRQILRVVDPKSVGKRVIVIGSKLLMLRTLAKKISQSMGVSHTPQQSDYSVMWTKVEAQVATNGPAKKLLKKLFNKFPRSIRYPINQYRARYNLSNREFFVPWTD